MTLVVDASAVVAALLDREGRGQWASGLLATRSAVAPHVMPFEVANVLRRAAAGGRVTRDAAALAHEDLLEMPVRLVPYEAVAGRVWELRGSITAYDASYVALSEKLGCELATTDTRLARAAGALCSFLLPPP